MMLKTCNGVASVAALLIAFGPLQAHAAPDAEGAGDHPLVERISGSYISNHYADEFKQISLPAGRFNHRERTYEEVVSLEGAWLKNIYNFEDLETSALRVHRSYLQTLPAAGFEIIFAGADSELVEAGRSASFFAGGEERHLLTRRGPVQNRQPAYYLLARHETEPVHVAIATYRGAGNPGETEYAVTVVTEEDMVVAMDHQPLSAGEMEQGLISEGRVAIQDIVFAVDSDEILPDSSSALATIAELMHDRTERGLLVVGHTDDTGDFDYNLRLSMTRATAVAAYLQREHGIAANRLRAAGAGMMAPIASNRSEDGRARNRRVELVEIRD